MSIQYDNYLGTHRACVGRGYYWIRDNLPELLKEVAWDYEYQICFSHDYSKEDMTLRKI